MRRLINIDNAANKGTVAQSNFETLDRSLAFALLPSLDEAGNPTTEIGPPVTGVHEVGELWVDAALVVWRCKEDGEPGTWFPAVGYRIYRALLTQTGTDAPVATVLENTIGDVVWGYVDEGRYTATLAGAFPEGKTTNVSGWINFGTGWAFTFNRQDNNSVLLDTQEAGTGWLNGLLNQTTITIYVYP